MPRSSGRTSSPPRYARSACARQASPTLPRPAHRTSWARSGSCNAAGSPHKSIEQARLLQKVDEKRQLPKRCKSHLPVAFDMHRARETVDKNPAAALDLQPQMVHPKGEGQSLSDRALHAHENARVLEPNANMPIAVFRIKGWSSEALRRDHLDWPSSDYDRSAWVC